MNRKAKANIAKYRVPSVEKAFSVIELFASNNRGYTLSEVSRSLKLPISSTSSLLYTVEQCGYLFRDDEGTYKLTMKLLNESNKALDHMGLREVAQPELKKLAKVTGLASVLSIREGDRLVCIDKIEGSSPIRIASSIGSLYYLHSSCTGKAILAFLSEEEVAAVVKSAGLPALTKHTITTLPALKKELAKVRAQGYSIDDEENSIGIRAIAAPVFDQVGRVIAAVSIGGAIFEITESMKAQVAHLKSCAAEVSRTFASHLTVP